MSGTRQGDTVVLEVVGVGAEDEELYRFLLREPESALGTIAARLGREPAAAAVSLQRLEDSGLVTRTSDDPPGWRASRPDVAIDLLVARRRAELDRVRTTSREWLAEMAVPEQYRPERLVEVVVGQQAIAARFAQLIQATESELRVLDRPPYASAPGASGPSVRGLLRDKVLVRGIYSPDSLSLPGAIDEAYSAVDAGERSRMHPVVPMKLAISDHREALLPLVVDKMIDSALVVHNSALLDALEQMFELLWDQALPVVAADEHDGTDTRLLTMLTAGLKDEAIARQLGISVRTVTRRVAELMDRLGARTRFQAGVHAERRRLFDDAGRPRG